MTEAFSDRPTTVADYLAIFRRRKWIVLVPPVVAAAAAFALSTAQSPLYQATAQVLVNPPSVVTAITRSTRRGTIPFASSRRRRASRARRSWRRGSQPRRGSRE